MVPKTALIDGGTRTAMSIVRIRACRAPICENASRSEPSPPPNPLAITADSGSTTMRPR